MRGETFNLLYVETRYVASLQGKKAILIYFYQTVATHNQYEYDLDRASVRNKNARN